MQIVRVSAFCVFLAAIVDAQRFVTNFTSPGWPGTYGNDGTKHRLYSASGTEQLSFNFHHLYLHQNDWISFAIGGEDRKWIWNNYDCAEGAHTEYKGQKETNTFTGLSTGDGDGRVCVKTSLSDGQNSDDKSANRYFAIVYAYRRCPSPADRQYLTERNFYMSSPYYPRNYPTDSECEWVISPRGIDKAQRIRLQFDQVDLGSGHYLDVTADGGARRISQAGRYEFKGPSVVVSFYAKGGSSARGYQFSYRVIGCPSTDLENRKNAIVTNDPTDFYGAEFQVYFRCNNGWEFQSGLHQEVYKCDGNTWTWSPIGSKTECIRSTCASLPDLANGQVVLTDGSNTGSEATFVCDGGYQLVGHTSSLRCSDDKSWSGGEMPRCEESSILACSKPIGPPNGKWECVKEPEVDGYECTGHGSVQKLRCNEGYYVNSTKNQIECQLTEWKGEALQCVPVCCEDLANNIASVPYLHYHQSGSCYRDTIEFRCETGYNLVGNAQTECDKTGKWQPLNLPICVIVMCEQPPQPTTSTTSISYQSTKYQSVATYSCKDPEKYDLIGPESVTCGADGRWSEDAAPICYKKQCEVTHLFLMAPGVKVRPVSDSYYVDDNVTLICGNINATVTCTPTGWTHVTLPPCGSSVRFLGELQSPEYPTPYNRNTPGTTIKQVTAEADERIVFLVKEVSLYKKDQYAVSSGPGADNDSCDPQSIKAYNGMNEASKSMTDVVITPSNRACLSFNINADSDVSNSTVDRLAYRGYYVQAYAIASCPGLKQGYTLAENSFYIASPRYPFVSPTDKICSWFIKPDGCSRGQRIIIDLEYVNTEVSVAGGQCIHPLTIGPIDLDYKTFCGFSQNVQLSVDGCTAGITFDTSNDAGKTDRGFFLSYRVSGCAEKDLPVKDNAEILNPSMYGHYEEGYTAIFTCLQGFDFESGAVEEYAVCDKSGNWQLYGADTLCAPIKCRADFTIANGVADKTGLVAYEDVVHIKCNDGFRLIGDSSLRCTVTGTWSSTVPSCVSEDVADLSCSPPKISNGRLKCDNGSCAVECDKEYYPIDTTTFSCVKGVWQPSDVELKCVPLTCDKLPIETDFDTPLQSVMPTDWVGSTAEYYCITGYDLVGPNFATCTANGTAGVWEFPDSTVPKCVLQECKLPPVTTTTTIDYFQKPVYNTAVTYSCLRGYDLVGSNQLVCGPNGRWLGTVPYCVTKTCDTDQIYQLLANSSSGSGVVWPEGLVNLNDFANVLCGNCSALNSSSDASSRPARAVCTTAGWNIDELYGCGCFDLPSPSSPSSLASIANVAFDYESGTGGDNSTGGAYVVARSFVTSSERNRLVFKASYLALKSGDVLSFHAGLTSIVDGEQRCSAAPSKLLHAYSGEIGQINDVIYSNEAACTQLSVQSKSRSSVEAAYASDNGYGYRFEAYEMPFCPSPLQPAVLTESTFVLVSPHYPDSYLPFESCGWTIAPSDCRKGQRLDFVVDYAEISQPHSLRFTFNADTPAATVVEISGSVRDKKFSSDGCNARVLFDTSYNAETNRGFEFSYEVTGCPEDSIPKPTDALVLGPSSDYHSAGSVVAFKCALGYQFTSGLSEEAVACTANYTWSQVSEISSCEPVQCAAIQEIENGEWSLWSSIAVGNETASTTYNATAKFKCNENYTLVGSETLVCGADGVWSASVPVCALPSDVYSCSTPAPTHGTANCTSSSSSSSVDECLSHGATQTVVCNTGYHISNADGDGKIVCSNSTWIPKPESLCEVNCCGNVTDTIGTFANIVVQTGSCYRDFVMVGCPFGYSLGGSRRLECTADGTWNGGAANCSIVECDREEVELWTNGTLQVAINGTTYGSVVTYWCEEGYDLVGESSRQCRGNGQWSGITPQCIPKKCYRADLKSLSNDLVIAGSKLVFDFGEKVRVRCRANSEQFDVFCGAYGWITEPIVINCAEPTTSVSPTTTTPYVTTTLEIITTQPVSFPIPRYVTNITSPNFPDEYPSQAIKMAKSVSNNGPSSERVVFGVRKSRLRPGDSLKLFSKPAASDTSCSLSSMVAQYEGGKTFGGAESDWVVTSTSTSCYMFETTDGQSSRDRAAESGEDAVGFTMDVYSLNSCPAASDQHILRAPSFVVASPEYPSQFPLNKLCHWWIAPTCSKQHIRFYISDNYIPCGNELRLIYDGETKRFCGSSPSEPQVLETASCNAEVVFDSTLALSSATGFRLSYSVVGCAANQLPTRSNTMYPLVDFYEAGAVVKYSCVTGMRFKSGKKEEQVRCSEGYEWELVDQPSECEMVTCPAVEKPKNGQVYVTSNEYGATARFGCDEMFRLSGDEVQVCGADGAWYGTQPTCVAIEFKSCGDPSVSLPNSKLTCIANCTSAGVGGQYVHGTVLQTECKVGFESASVSTIRCVNGTWSPTVSDCSRICCKPLEASGTSALPERSVEATAIVGGSCFNDSVTFKCGKAYKLVGSEVSRCQLDKTWSATAPYCEPVKCGKPRRTSNSLLVETNCESYGCVATFSCVEGYKLVGSATLTCNEKGEWGTLPTCSISTCRVSDLEAMLPAGASVSGSASTTGSVNFGGTISVLCLSSTYRVRCGPYSWELGSLASRSCEPNYCLAEQLKEIASLTGTTLSMDLEKETVAEGTSVKLVCESKTVAVATCGTVTWQTDISASEIRATCESFKTTISATTSASVTASVANATTELKPVAVVQDGSGGLVIGLGVATAVFGIACVVLLIWIIMVLRNPRRKSSDSMSNPMYESNALETFPSTSRKETDTGVYVEYDNSSIYSKVQKTPRNNETLTPVNS